MAKKAYPIVSGNGIIRKIQRDFRPNYDSWISDAPHWIFEAIMEIGVYDALDTRVASLTVENYKATLPCNFEDLEVVTLCGRRLRKSISSNIGGQIGVGSGSYKNTTGFMYGDATYQPRGNQLYFSFPENKDPDDVQVVYKAIRIDDDGMPVIPYIPIYMRAVSWYVLTHMMLGGFEMKGYNAEMAEQKFKQYAGQAANMLQFWTPDDAERMKRWWANGIFRERSWDDDFIDFNGEYEYSI